ncbi:sentrin-specific protease 5-like isoform X1 [Anguilla anguilla]|uniref:sentrin-specific protease 5-like isoform X1 n=1 Tax=Anguilla anguilla TaxID=7936 RepID=UPI0015AF3F03|nr:sentrin-specific protease 5-like isoform X1 [Anguilla anguilla]XP_035279591.1 sentrin-specific protease 5-like isoform X1 [Anguilla anguilla]
MRTNSFARLHRNRFWLQARGMLFSKYRSLSHIRRKGILSHVHKTRRTHFRLKKLSRTRVKPQGSAQVAVHLGAEVVKHDITEGQSPGCPLKTDNPEEVHSADMSAAISGCPVVLSEESAVHAPPLELSSIHFSLNVIGQTVDNVHPSCASPEEAGQRTKQTAECRSVKRSLSKKSSRLSRNGRRRGLPLLKWHRRLSRFDFQFCRYRVGSSWFGRCRKGRKSRNIPHISNLRDNSQKAKVLPYLSSPNTEPKDLIREGSGNDLKKLGKIERVPEEGGSEPAEGTLAQDQSALSVWSSGLEAVCGPAGGNKHTSMSCDSSGPKTQPQLDKPEGPEISRVDHSHSSGISGLEIDKQTLPASSPPAGDGEDKEAALPPPCLVQGSGPLRDHRYCRTTVGAPNSVTHSKNLRTKEVAATSSQLLSKQVTNEAIKELIHEYLKHFYGKHGSFIPLSKSDVLKHLNNKLNTDLKDRKSLIYTELTKYQAVLASSPMRCFKVVYNKHMLTLEDLSTLDNQNWVNDQVINMYGELIEEAVNHKVHFFNSFFHRQLVTKGYEGVKRWTKKVDLFTKKLLLIPIHLEIHWSLITVDIATRNVYFYDSQGIVFRHAIENILKYIMAEAKEKEQMVYQKGWKMIINKRIPQQRNDNDCGVFVLEYCKCLALGRPLQFSQADMPKIRKRIYKELCDCKLAE